MIIDPTSLSALATGRASDLFSDDLAASDSMLHERIGNSRILAIGGAGSIGAATLRVLTQYRPAALHVVDQSENMLTELVRDLRSRPEPFDIPDFRALPLDYGAPVMQRLLRAEEPYDFVLNFAALKHVRSEKDVYSLTQLLDTNVVKQVQFLQWLAELGWAGRYFCVSTDKAANPVNLMGASKRSMEHLIFSRAVAPELGASVTSARFANVAFSDGSLLDGFLRRLQKRQPLAVPRDTRRYFVSLSEAGQICTLAAVLAPADHIVIPRLNADVDLKDLQSIAEAVLHAAGLQARIYTDEAAARAAVARDLTEQAYPLLLTPLDTSGEKPFEEFIGAGEQAVEIGMQRLAAVRYLPAPADQVRAFVSNVQALVHGEIHPAKDEVVEWFAELIPEFKHVETWKSLDQRM